MIRHLPPLLGLAWLALFAGCTASRSPALPEPRPLGAALPVYHPPEATTNPEPTPLLPVAERLTLPEALAHALLRSPRLQAFAWGVRAQEASARQAGRPPNPEVELDIEEFGGTGLRSGAGAAEAALVLGQVEVGAQLAHRLLPALGVQQLVGVGEARPGDGRVLVHEAREVLEAVHGTPRYTGRGCVGGRRAGHIRTVAIVTLSRPEGARC